MYGETQRKRAVDSCPPYLNTIRIGNHDQNKRVVDTMTNDIQRPNGKDYDGRSLLNFQFAICAAGRPRWWTTFLKFQPVGRFGMDRSDRCVPHVTTA
jgi:hypothetical protein